MIMDRRTFETLEQFLQLAERQTTALERIAAALEAPAPARLSGEPVTIQPVYPKRECDQV